MQKIVVTGGVPLDGEVRISGAKNAVLPILCATLLADEPVEIGNVPHLHDVRTTARLLGGLGAGIGHDIEAGIVRVDPCTVDSQLAPYDLVRTMRASVLVLGPLLAKHGTKAFYTGGLAEEMVSAVTDPATDPDTDLPVPPGHLALEDLAVVTALAQRV
jgi:UDP-N-acetylglucosamine enolpyruvyl transferase